MRENERVDLIESASDLWLWLMEAGVLSHADGDLAACLVPEEDALREAKELRAALRRMADQIAAGEAVSSDVIETLNAHLGRRRGCTQLALSDGIWRMEFQAEDAHGLDFLFPVAQSAADLIAHSDRDLIRKCESARCILYFYDTTKNHGRRWCSMEGCGNRHKAAEHYRRRREKNAPQETLEPEKPLS